MNQKNDFAETSDPVKVHQIRSAKFTALHDVSMKVRRREIASKAGLAVKPFGRLFELDAEERQEVAICRVRAADPTLVLGHKTTRDETTEKEETLN